MRSPLIFSFLFLLHSTISAQQGIKPVKVTDLLKIRSAGGISLSHDGSQAVYTVTSSEAGENDKDNYRYVSRVWLTNTRGTPKPRQLSFRENSSQGVISPDGKTVAFVRNADGHSQIFLLSLDGGEAWQLTHYPYGAGNPSWSPDGTHLLFSCSVSYANLLEDILLNPGLKNAPWPMEKPGIHEKASSLQVKADPDGSLDEIRAYLKENEDDEKAKVVNKLNFQDESGVSTQMNFTHYLVTGIQPGDVPVPVTRGFFRYTSATFTPSGEKIILTGNLDSLQNPDRALESGIYRVNTDGSGLETLLAEKDKIFSSPVISPSGKWMAFQYGSTSFISVPSLCVMPVNGTFSEKFYLPFDRTKSNLVWSADEKFIYFVSPSKGAQPLFRMNLATRKAEQLTGDSSGILNFNLSGNSLVYVETAVTSPFEVYVSGTDLKDRRRAGNLNSWTAYRKLSVPEKHSFINNQGMEVDYWIMKPAFYEPGKKYPLLLEIHGGPSAMWGPGESSMWHEYQYFCSQGYGVVYCNPRGSGGYGYDFLKANTGDWGEGPTSDVLTALDKTLAAEPWADSSRLLVTGGSYAGYLVAWIISHDHRFKAACSQRGVYDLATFFGEGNAWRLVPMYFGGYPWEKETHALLERESPITYVENITTPYIIFHGENDRRTGVIQGEMLYRSLKVLGRPVEYVRHPGATHEITRSGDNRQRMDQMLRTYEFFERWIH